MKKWQVIATRTETVCLTVEAEDMVDRDILVMGRLHTPALGDGTETPQTKIEHRQVGGWGLTSIQEVHQ